MYTYSDVDIIAQLDKSKILFLVSINPDIYVPYNIDPATKPTELDRFSGPRSFSCSQSLYISQYIAKITLMHGTGGEGLWT